MREGYVAHAEIGEDAHDADIVADHVAAFHTHQRGDLTLRVSTANVVGSARERHFVRILLDIFVDGVYLIEGFLHGGRAHDVSVDPDGEEDGVHTAFSHA